MLIYSFHIYAWLVSLLKIVDQWIRNFIWSGDIMTRKVVTVAWHKVCSPFLEGGLGIKPLRSINAAVSLKLCWNVLTDLGHWASFLRARFLVNGAPSPRCFCSSIWSPIRYNFTAIDDNSAWLLGDGKSINFWTDYWLSAPIVDWLHVPPNLYPFLKAHVSDFINNTFWSFPTEFSHLFPMLAQEIREIHITYQAMRD